MCKNRVSVNGWSPIGCEGFYTKLNIPIPLPTTLVFHSCCRLLICICMHICMYMYMYKYVYMYICICVCVSVCVYVCVYV